MLPQPEWFWAVKNRLSYERRRGIGTPLSVASLAWLFAAFRDAFPNVPHPNGAWSGDKNPWDASEFLTSLLARLADMTSDDAVGAMLRLRDAPEDGYTPTIKALAAEQHRKRTEARYRPPALSEVRAIVEAMPPRTVADMQAVMLELLEGVQRRIRASPSNPWRDFYRDDLRTPRNEERCRDHLLDLLGVRPEGMDLSIETQLAETKLADLTAMLDGMRLVMEAKGQWHRDLWHAADTQLDRLYASDYLAERRGIYLVFWFGPGVPPSKRLKSRGRGIANPTTPMELQEALTAASAAARDGRVRIVVLDVERSVVV